jgi:hypothetical protein
VTAQGAVAGNSRLAGRVAVAGLAAVLAIDLVFLPWWDNGLSTGIGTPDGWLGVLGVLATAGLLADVTLGRLLPQGRLLPLGSTRMLVIAAVACVALKVFFSWKLLRFHIETRPLGTGFWVAIVLAGLLLALTVWERHGVTRRVARGAGDIGKVRSFWVGLGLTVVTLGVYHCVWWYLINDELRDVGMAAGDQKLARSNPTNSAAAILVGWPLVVPPVISIYNTACRIERAQQLCGIDAAQTINPMLALLLLFPGGLLVVPAFIHYWYVTHHHNAAIRAAGRLPVARPPELVPAARIG